MQNIGRDLYNNSENTKKETTEFEKTSWAARLYNVETGTVTYFAEELLDKFQGRPAYKLPNHKGDYQCRVIDLSKGEF